MHLYIDTKRKRYNVSIDFKGSDTITRSNIEEEAEEWQKYLGTSDRYLTFICH